MKIKLQHSNSSSMNRPISLYSLQLEKFISYILIVFSFTTLWLYLYTPILDGDLWFHFLYGKAILENFTLIPDHTIYSWTPSSNETIYCTWIGQILYYLTYKFFNYSGIIFLRYLFVTVLFIAILVISLQRYSLRNPLTWLAATLSILAIGPATFDKPESFSFFLMTLLVLNYFYIKQTKNNAIYFIYLIPFIMLIWVNSHGAFIFGCVFLFCIGIGETLNKIFAKQSSLPNFIYKHLWSALIISSIAVFITPYGFSYIQQLASSFNDNQLSNHFANIVAYMGTFDMHGFRMPIFAYSSVSILFFTLFFSLRGNRFDFSPFIINFVFAIIFSKYSRSTYFWAPIFTITIAYYASTFSIANQLYRKLITCVFTIACIVLSGWILLQEKCYPTKERWLDFGLMEFVAIDEEIEFLRNNFPHAKLGNMYDHGSYILYKMWPKKQVMIDARYFPYKSWFTEYSDFEAGKNVEKFIKKFPFQVIEIKHDAFELIRWFYNSNDWSLVFYGKGAIIFALKSISHKNDFQRGQNLSSILSYRTGLDVFNTAIFIRDWIGAKIILNRMKSKFLCDYQNRTITGLEYNLEARRLYFDRKYSQSITYIKKAIALKVLDIDLYSAAIVNKSVQEWENSQFEASLKTAIEAIAIKNTFETFYNLAIISSQIEKMQNYKNFSNLKLSKKELEIAKNWQELLKNIINNKDNLHPKYHNYLINIRNLLNNTPNTDYQLIKYEL